MTGIKVIKIEDFQIRKRQYDRGPVVLHIPSNIELWSKTYGKPSSNPAYIHISKKYHWHFSLRYLVKSERIADGIRIVEYKFETRIHREGHFRLPWSPFRLRWTPELVRQLAYMILLLQNCNKLKSSASASTVEVLFRPPNLSRRLHCKISARLQSLHQVKAAIE